MLIYFCNFVNEFCCCYVCPSAAVAVAVAERRMGGGSLVVSFILELCSSVARKLRLIYLTLLMARRRGEFFDLGEAGGRWGAGGTSVLRARC